jgi:hypothetical protein
MVSTSTRAVVVAAHVVAELAAVAHLRLLIYGLFAGSTSGAYLLILVFVSVDAVDAHTHILGKARGR